MNLLSHLRLQFIHLKKHKFRHSFNETINPDTEQFLLCCHCFSNKRSELFDNIYRRDPSFSKLNTKEKVAYLLYCATSNSSSLNKDVIKLVIKFLKSTGRFNKSLIFDLWNVKFVTLFTAEAAIKGSSEIWVLLEI